MFMNEKTERGLYLVTKEVKIKGGTLVISCVIKVKTNLDLMIRSVIMIHKATMTLEKIIPTDKLQ